MMQQIFYQAVISVNVISANLSQCNVKLRNPQIMRFFGEF